MAGNAARRIMKSTLDEVPLWKRKIPKYPLYYMGDPKHRVYLPQFWMKMVKPKFEIPPDRVQFIVHPHYNLDLDGMSSYSASHLDPNCLQRMSKMDIKQYLEKIYDVKVAEVRTTIRKGKFTVLRPDNRVGTFMHRNLPMDKYAFVTLADNQFAYPDWFDSGVETEQMKEEGQFDDAEGVFKKGMEKKSKAGIPPWFWR